ncbi:SpaH/EbpB family LPXTG-anchored major pilin [Corynebacterium diphtheriae]|uniref:SpaH/EbpB family LPXTG-anchored major pilin n=1 Tax=Corynebacterium diphtheriae TaxID=1717 RepID=UPI0018C94A73|nr:SpaH/EbpB family LPXTG-anchored major pilin [Corynebacterium diphtheriae bv. mitis]
MNKFSRTARSVTFAAIVGLSMGVTAPAALAAPAGEASNAQSVNDHVITQDKGSLTIHKKANPASLGKPTGEAADAQTASGQPLEGIEFTVYKLNDYDLKTNNGLAKAAGLKASQFVEGNALKPSVKATQVVKDTTKAGGKLEIDNLDLGVYLVIESNSVANGATYTPAVPFLAFIPMTRDNGGDVQGTTWNYDVHAVPKNYLKTPPVKEVKDLDHNIGGTYEYDIKSVVRNITEGKKLAYYWIGDTLDATNLNAAQAAITVSVGGAEVNQGVDYTLEKSNETGHFLVKFTKEGLKKLKSGSKVTVNVKAEKITGEEVVVNEAREYEPSNPASDAGLEDEPTNLGPGDGSTPTEPVFTYSSGAEFTKVSQDKAPLQGAEFKLFRSAPGVKECSAFNRDSEGALTAWDGAKKSDVFVSGQDGKVSITGLHVNDFADNKELSEDQQTVYCLVEIKAPAGKELLSKPIQFELKKVGDSTVKRDTYWHNNKTGAVEKQETKTYKVRDYELVALQVGDQKGKVVNLDDTTLNLPMTGGVGVGILAAIGAAIVAAGAWFARRGTKN